MWETTEGLSVLKIYGGNNPCAKANDGDADGEVNAKNIGPKCKAAFGIGLEHPQPPMTPSSAQCSCADDFACADAKTGEACNEAQGLLSVKQGREHEWAFRRLKIACIELRGNVDVLNRHDITTEALLNPPRCNYEGPARELQSYWSGDHRPKVTTRGALEHNGG